MKTKGQSLIEMVVIIGITGIALVALAITTTTSIRNARVAKERASARNIVEQTMETIRNSRDTDPTGFFGAGSHTDTLSTVGTDPIYNRTASYTEIIPGSKIEVTVTVSWEDSGGTFNFSNSTTLQKW